MPGDDVSHVRQGRIPLVSVLAVYVGIPAEFVPGPGFAGCGFEVDATITVFGRNLAEAGGELRLPVDNCLRLWAERTAAGRGLCRRRERIQTPVQRCCEPSIGRGDRIECPAEISRPVTRVGVEYFLPNRLIASEKDAGQ